MAACITRICRRSAFWSKNGSEKSPLNLADGEGNFFLKPNGVFLVGKDGKAAVMETSAYAAAKPDVAFATQSGPMLVIDGQLHPRFEPNGTSRYISNGVGVRDGNTVVLAISRSEVSFGSFARLFRDALQCRNALFLDGVVSALSDGDRMIVGGKYPAGPIISVSAEADHASVGEKVTTKCQSGTLVCSASACSTPPILPFSAS